MTTVQHAVQGFIISYLIWDNPLFIIYSVYLSIRSDVEKFFYGEKWNDWNGKYKELHADTINNWLMPFQNLHLFFDKLMHKKEGGWKKSAYLLEIIFWIVEGIVFYKLYLI